MGGQGQQPRHRLFNVQQRGSTSRHDQSAAPMPACCGPATAGDINSPDTSARPLPPPAGLLTSGLIPSVRHALGSLLTIDAILLPSSATVYCQAVELRTREVAGLDMSAANQYRWHPAYAAGERALVPHVLVACSAQTSRRCTLGCCCPLPQACPWRTTGSWPCQSPKRCGTLTWVRRRTGATSRRLTWRSPGEKAGRAGMRVKRHCAVIEGAKKVRRHASCWRGWDGSGEAVQQKTPAVLCPFAVGLKNTH